MPEYCDVALPVPLDMVFTYGVSPEATPVVGGRVLVPFRQQRLTGIVVELHDRKPSVKTKSILSVLDAAPVFDEQLLRLGRWIADYYLAPLGEVFRTMLPLNAEVRRAVSWLYIWRACRDRPHVRVALPRNKLPNFACWITSPLKSLRPESLSRFAKKACVRLRASPG
jgi:primosomal protein N'